MLTNPATTEGVLFMQTILMSMSEREEQIAKQRGITPKSYQGVYDRAVAGQCLRAAINARCLDCCAWQRIEVRQCPAMPCPLWAVRPYQDATESLKDPVTGGCKEEKVLRVVS